MRVIMEFIRIIVILLILGGLKGAFLKFIYTSFGINVDNANGPWLVGLSILILLFVLYRNKLQFSGFYKGSGKVKLSKKVSM
ncbi:hypothetical protein L1999_13365 [Neobacillus drentensis]|uniref:hypothetical protein n=1 Tax=Neobacillus drentensis TaxID=220684 RepID=UPI001F2F777D|nr:hypothetical protein [Neobacillus drentensis]ULT59450.1 hypothetical protein L1999_13365 [Neobacillus drentensis]